MAHLHKGNIKAAQKELKTLKKRKRKAVFKKKDAAHFPIVGMSNICYLILASEIAGQKGDLSKK